MGESDILELLKAHAGNEWLPGYRGPQPAVTIAAEQRVSQQFPHDYKRVLAEYGDGTLRGPGTMILLIPPDQLAEFNPDPEMPSLAEMLVFAHDGGDYFYFFDPKNRLGKGPWAIFAVVMGPSELADALPIAHSLLELFQRILQGEDMIDAALDVRLRSRKRKTP